MDRCEEFARKFNEINTPLIGRRQRDLNHLLATLKQSHLNNEDLLRLESLVQPTNYLEEKFKLIVFMQLKVVDYLFKIFESEHLFLIGKLVKDKWLFQEGFLHVKGEELVNVLFEKVSPNTRVNIINKLAKHLQHEAVAEEYFVSVLNKYGLNCASNLIPNCSVKFVRNVLDKYEVKFSDKQLQKIVKKDVTFAAFYFEKFCAIRHYCVNVADYLLVLHYVASVDFALFMSIFDKYELKIKLNENLTKKVFAYKKNDVIARPVHYLGFMHYNTLLKLLGDDFKAFYANSFPKLIDEFQNTISTPQKLYSARNRTYKLIQYLPRQEKYEMLTNTFLQVYKVDIFQYPNFINEYFVHFMPDQERIKWAKQLLKNDKWICYVQPKESVLMLKDKITLKSDTDSRSIYLNYLIETCRIHRDLNALLEVLKYFISRHRNEDTYIVQSIIWKLKDSFKLNTLSSEHWAEINRLLKICNLTDDSNFKNEFTQYLNDSNIEDDKVVINLLNEVLECGYSAPTFHYNLDKHKKQFILRAAVLVPKHYNDKELYAACRVLITGIVDWNTRNPQEQIDMYEFPEIIRNIMDEKNEDQRDNYAFKNFLIVALQAKGESEEKDLVRKEFFGNLLKYWLIGQSLILKLLKEEPHVILKHTNDIVGAAVFYSGKEFMQRAKFYSHLQIPQKLKEGFLEALRTNDHKYEAIIHLPHLMPTKEYIDTMKQYHVTNSRVDLDEESDIFENQKNFIEALNFADTFSLTVPILKQYCAGDYLRHSLGTLYRVVDYTPESKTQVLINELFDRAVSVRKHAIFLTAHTRDTRTVYECLKEMGQKEKNSSLLKFILKRTFKYFCKNPSEEFWELFKTNSYRIRNDDDEAFNYFFQTDSVPYKYLAKYVEFAYERVEESTLDSVKSKKISLLRHINDDNINMFSDSFCRKILETNLFGNHDNFYALRLCCTYLSASVEGNTNLEFVCSLLKEYVQTKWINTECGKNREVVGDFLSEVCNSFRNKNNVQLLNKFASYWYNTVDILEAFKEHLILQFTILYMTCETEMKKRNFAHKVSDFFNENVQKLGLAIIPIFSATLNDTISDFFYDYQEAKPENPFQIYTDLINVNKSPEMFALIMNLLPNQYSLTQDIAKQHRMLLLEISQCNEPWVKILYNHYFKSLEPAP